MSFPLLPIRNSNVLISWGKNLILVFYPADWSLVYGDQVALYNKMLKGCVAALQLNANKIENNIITSNFQDKIETDFEGGVRSAVNGAPSCFVNNQRWEDYAGTYDFFIELIS